jgi:D-aminopeptidase
MNTSVNSALDALFEPFQRSDAPGMVVGIAHHGQTIYRRAFGLASIEHGVANTPWTRMRIGSTSKHFACLAALLLVEEGKLDIDASIRNYLPALHAMQPEPTLRQCMTHTSGLRDSLDLGLMASGMTIKPRGEGLAAQVRQRDVNFAPGDKIVYNNGAYQMLSLIIENVSGMPFEQFLKERLFSPLRMADTQSIASDFEIHPGLATMHVAQSDGSYRRGIFPTEEVRGEGGIVSTIDDMLRWLAHLRGPHTVGSEESWAQMLAPARLNNGMDCTYALGLMVEKYRGVDVIHHGGTVIGGTCQMLTVPHHELDIIVISNGAQVSVADLANKAVEALLGQEAFPQAPAQDAQSASFQYLLDAVYASPSADMVLGFGDAGGKLGLMIHNSPPIPARQEGGALWLDFNRVVTGPYCVEVGDTAPDTLDLVDAGAVQRLALLPAPPTLAEAGRDLVGSYSAHDLDARVRIEFEGDALLVRLASTYGPNLLTLKALSNDLFGWKLTGELAALGGTLNVERSAGKVAGLRLNTFRTRHMYFQRLDD